MSNQQQITPAQAIQVLTELAQLPTLKLNLQEHSAVQAALAVLKPLTEPVPNGIPALTA